MVQGMEAIAMPTAGRAVLVGKSRSGKSTLAERLIQHWRASQPNPRVLIVDTKPRFRATHELNGMTTAASRRYKKWRHGAEVPRSVVMPAGVHVRHAMQQTWRLGFDTAIAQVPNLHGVDWLRAAMEWFYTDSDAQVQQLLYMDEVADFFSSSGTYGRGDSIVQSVRSGGERGVAVLAGTQRPTGVPKSFFSEATRIYLFKLKYKRDLQHLQDSILPEDMLPPREKYIFHLYDDEEDRRGVYRLRLEGQQ